MTNTILNAQTKDELVVFEGDEKICQKFIDDKDKFYFLDKPKELAYSKQEFERKFSKQRVVQQCPNINEKINEVLPTLSSNDISVFWSSPYSIYYDIDITNDGKYETVILFTKVTWGDRRRTYYDYIFKVDQKCNVEHIYGASLSGRNSKSIELFQFESKYYFLYPCKYKICAEDIYRYNEPLKKIKKVCDIRTKIEAEKDCQRNWYQKNSDYCKKHLNQIKETK